MRALLFANRATTAEANSDELILDGLNEVNWNDLEHAFSEAAAVPGLLQDLASRDSERGEKALYQFYGDTPIHRIAR